MVVVPESGGLPIICQVPLPEHDEQWGDVETPIPPGSQAVPVLMKRGDVLFFNGSLIHGSYRSRSDRFRRTLIGHYIAAEAQQVAKYYFPVFRMDGTTVEEGIETSLTSGPCGVYEGSQVVLSGSFKTWESAH